MVRCGPSASSRRWRSCGGIGCWWSRSRRSRFTQEPARLLYDALQQASRHGSVLVTTHSVDLLDAAADDAILVCRYDHGVSRIGPLARAQRAVVKDGLFSLAELVRSEPLRIEGDPLPTVDV
jgi:glycine/D-amino acid oxidase-like deaminating enzyme